ncbi:hypothetical protein M5X00_14925 [Paenibacillus alvei]|uniref:Uncharacterized protein n=1 Tax=Paenibacillus alvei TaxID=44250 RepID=A0ABT4H543_PAEAL|nr:MULTISPECIES: hypothetical protein [Paenibacillus]EJW18912.1 hypothetical protein PAV_2c06900 [Paenibacillus alvei DSM 29]MCY7487233.1 hypothetical protein [Paenibacillus alvei]MCY9539271.1 hypothetical protein [Paenibacillus alvei]MCY9706054.1 hypothetical protein [Paenibacillus alvei]MCY9736764.1 hypothetical protein [Paenibacillus alvei]
MGVSFGRPYQDILEELTNAIGLIPDGYTFFEMTEEDWAELGQAERKEVLEALADDVFYGLGEDRLLFIGSGSVQYDPQFHTIEIVVESDTVATISLI